MPEKDYRKLYLIQNKVLETLKPVIGEYYLTGGTALGRFYLNHRFSDDLDFFINADPRFAEMTNLIGKKLNNEFSLSREQTIIYDDFTRFYLDFEDTVLKIEFVNDIPYRCGNALEYEFGLIDTPLNILTNKLTAIISRDEPKDIFDIYSISRNYSFNWNKVFAEAKKKAIINELDIDQRLRNFPIELMVQVNWFLNPLDNDLFTRDILSIANDFILGEDNSLAKNNSPIEDAKPKIFNP